MLESLKVETPAKEKSFDFQHDYAFLKTTRGQDECLIVANMGFGEPRRLFWKESEPDGGWKASLDEATIFNEKGAALARTKTVPKPESV